MSAPYLFSPGPVNVESSVRNALMHYDICHRGKEFEEMFEDTQRKINRLFQADGSYYSMIISGSGTSANEAVLSSIFKQNEEVLLISNGMFGERLEEIILKYKVQMHKPPFQWAEYPNMGIIEQYLKMNKRISVVAMVFHETSTGMINPVREVGELCRQYGKKFFVDAISAAGGEYIDVVSNHIDITTTVGGKCLGAFPGSAMVCAREEILASLRDEDSKNVYLDLKKHYTYAKDLHQTPNTPNVNLFWPLNKALSNLLERGLENQIERYRENADVIRQAVEELGLRFLLDRKYMSNTVTSVFLPEGMEVKKFLDDMEAHRYVLYIGKGIFKEQNMFQIANMGNIDKDGCVKLMKCMKKCLNDGGAATTLSQAAGLSL